MGGTDKDGRIYFCHKHHGIITGMNVQWLWVTRFKDKEEIYQFFKDQTERWKNI